MDVSLVTQYDWDSIYGRYGNITQTYAVKSVVCVNYACMGVWFAFKTTDVVLITALVCYNWISVF